MLKLTPSLFSGLAIIAIAAFQNSAQAQKPSPAADTSVTINGKKIAIKYSAPSMRGRKIFGGLVPYGQVWRAGANEATSLTTEADLDLNGLKVPAGNYTLYVMPDANQWQLVVNKQTGQWGTVYKEDQDLGRVKMTMGKSSAPVEQYKMTLSSEGGNKGKLSLEWENTTASVPFTAK